MKKTTVKYFCDVCAKETASANKVEVPVVFKTEQTEGRPVKPYLTKEYLDLCDSCSDTLIERTPLWGHGAQGHNSFWWKKEEAIN